ncbi:MAG: RAMP superfamily CRISPR-associated protein [Promethearchaeota archaeon]
MLKLNKKRSTSRILFQKDFIQFQVSLTLLNNNYLFIGSNWDEIEEIPEEYFSMEKSFEECINHISKQINSVSSTILIGGKPIIPGSTLKGAIRFRVEHSFKPDKNNEIFSCFIKQSRPAPKSMIKNFLKAFGYGNNIPPTRPNEDINLIKENCCQTCDLFGNSSLEGRIFFSDAEPINASMKIIILQVRAGRDEKRVIAPGSTFNFTVGIKNVDDIDLALLYLGMNLHNDGTILLGMNKFATRREINGNIIHFGKVKLNINEIKRYSSENGRITIIHEDLNQINEKASKKVEELRPILRNF